MSDIIYIKDILLKKAGENKKRSGRPKLRPFEQKSVRMVEKSENQLNQLKRRRTTILRSSLVEQDKKENNGYQK